MNPNELWILEAARERERELEARPWWLAAPRPPARRWRRLLRVAWLLLLNW